MAKKARPSPPKNQIGTLYTTEEVASILKQNIRTVQRMIKDKKLPAYRVGRKYKIKESELMNFLEQSRTVNENE
jgi:putative molybdopterin biosynthesis protein